MNEHFSRFKKQAFAIRFIKAFLLAVACGGLVAGVCWLLTKREIWTLKPTVCFLLGGGTFLLFGVAGFFLFRISDRKLAQRLDSQYNLQERVQTSLAYKDQIGTIYDMQRKDADTVIASIGKKRLSFKSLWALVVGAVIGLGALISAFIVPIKVTPPIEIPEEEFAITEIQVTAMDELIKYVENSKMQEPYKGNVVTALGELLTQLQDATTVTQKNTALEKAVDEIYWQTDQSSIAVEVMDSLWYYEIESVKLIAKSLNYYDWAKGSEWEDFSDELKELRISFIHEQSGAEEKDEALMATETGELLARTRTSVNQTITRFSANGGDDALFVGLRRLVDSNESYDNGTHLYGLGKLAELAESLGYETLQKELDATLSSVGSEIFKSLGQHKTNTDTGEYAMTKLKELFGYSLPRFKRPNFYEVLQEDGGEEEESGSGNAGIGDGAVYGSDDLVYDPLTNTYVEYGTILDKYYQKVFGKLDGEGYTDEEKEALEKYFAILYGGFDTKGDNGNE